jgi:hypothetical protein
MLSPMLPALYLESKWSRSLNNQERSTSILFDIVKKHRFTFIMTGFALSFIQLIVGLVLQYFIFKTDISEEEGYAVRYSVDYIPLLFFIIVTAFIAVYVVASFYRVRTEDHATGKRYNYLSSPSQVVLLLSYAYIGINIDFSILWFGHATNRAPTIERFDLVPLEYLTSGLIIPLLIMNLVFFPIAVFVAGVLPSLIMGAVYRKPSRVQVKNWLLKLVPFIIFVTMVTSFIIRISENTANSDEINLIHIILLVLPVGLFIFIAKDYHLSGNMCPNCNLLMDKDDFCKSCTEGEAIPIRIDFISKLQHPYCPSCGTIWSTLSRKCINPNCNYTVLLSCEKCSQTLNPLWNRCNVCGTKRSPIPYLALQSPGSPSYARNQAFLMILMSLIIPAAILQITIIVNMFSRVNNGIYNVVVLNTVFDDIARFIVLFITIIAIFTIIRASFNDKKRPMMLVANRIATSAGSILISTAFFVLFVHSFTRIFTEGFNGLISRLFTLLFSLLMVLTSSYNYYKSLIQFRPIVGFDPTIAIDKIGG